MPCAADSITLFYNFLPYRTPQKLLPCHHISTYLWYACIIYILYISLHSSVWCTIVLCMKQGTLLLDQRPVILMITPILLKICWNTIVWVCGMHVNLYNIVFSVLLYFLQVINDCKVVTVFKFYEYVFWRVSLSVL